MNLLEWEQKDGFQEAILGTKEDGVVFCLTYQPTCYRRGPWKLYIEVIPGEHHESWGCFDDQDQPTRYYHNAYVPIIESELIAAVFVKDRMKKGPIQLEFKGNDFS